MHVLARCINVLHPDLLVTDCTQPRTGLPESSNLKSTLEMNKRANPGHFLFPFQESILTGVRPVLPLDVSSDGQCKKGIHPGPVYPPYTSNTGQNKYKTFMSGNHENFN